jgi:hypothetical protein
VSRSPKAGEVETLQHLLASASSEGQTESPPVERWTAVARVLLNLDETITRE